MDIDPSHGNAMRADFNIVVDDVPFDPPPFPTEIVGEILSCLPIRDVAAVVQVNKLLFATFHLASVSNVFVLLHHASTERDVDVAIGAIPRMPPRDCLALLHAMIRRLIERDPWHPGLRTKLLTGTLDETWQILSSDGNAYRRHDGRQHYLLAKSLLITHIYAGRNDGDMTALREEIRDMPVRYLPKIFVTLMAGMRFMETKYGLYSHRAFVSEKSPYSFDDDMQLLIDQSNVLERPVPASILAEMAVVMLLSKKRANIRETLCRCFEISDEAEITRLEMGVASALVSRIPYYRISLDCFLTRWSNDSTAIRRLFHESLAMSFVSRKTKMGGVWQYWDASNMHIPCRGGASEWAIGMPEDAVPTFSDLGKTAMRFWELAWMGTITFPRAQDQLTAILEMPWQLQPTLIDVLVQRFDAGRLYDYGFDISAWSAQRVAQCLDHGYGMAAMRACLIPFKSARLFGEASERTVKMLQKAVSFAVAHIPPAHWGPLIASVASVASVEPNGDGRAEWPTVGDLLTLMTTFVRDPAFYNVTPMMNVYGGDYVIKIWDSFQGDAAYSDAQFEQFCTRLNIAPELRAYVARQILDGQRSQEQA